MKRKLSLAAVLVTVAGLSVAAMYMRRGSETPVVATDVVSRGSIRTIVSATGTLEAVDTVQVGTQVSGTIRSLSADFNSIVRKGQVLARLDPSLIQAEIDRAQANLLGAEADAERLRVQLTDAQTKLARARQLSARQLIATSDLDAAEIAVRSAEAQVKSASAQVTQARAAVSQAQVNLQKTVITSPIDGIVISRAVDVGQTVAASLQAPTLFTIAADLRQMQLKASIDESDLGSVRDGQTVAFRVDAYPNDVFSGRVRQVRLNPVIEQNVVTYAAIVSAPNVDLKLKPGMTATITVEVARRDNVLRVPNTALNFKPSAAAVAALGSAPVATGTAGIRPIAATTDAKATRARRTVWVYADGDLRQADVAVGLSDGTFTEIVDGDVEEGTTLATRVTMPGAAATGATRSQPTSNPLLGQPTRRM